MNDLSVVERAPGWQRLKALVLDSVSSPITRRVYNMALDEFVAWLRREPRPGFSKATVNAWRVSLEARGLGSSSISVRMSAVRKLAAEAADNGLLAPELAAGIIRVKGVKSTGVRVGNWLSLRQAQDLLGAPDIATLPPWVKVAMDAWTSAAGLAEGHVFRPVTRAQSVGGERLGEKVVWQMLQHYAGAAGVPGLAPHDLRRTCAKLCRASGGELEQIQMLLGHASVQTTKRYLGTKQDLVHAPNDAIKLSIVN